MAGFVSTESTLTHANVLKTTLEQTVRHVRWTVISSNYNLKTLLFEIALV